MENYEIDVKVIEEAGYHSAMVGISLNKDKNPEEMHQVALNLAPKDGGHNKFLEQMIMWLIVRAPRYWWQEADTFRLSSKSSQSTMHTILKNELVSENFECGNIPSEQLKTCNYLLNNRELVNLKRQLTEGFMQKRMWMVSYKTMRNIIIQRRNHRLPHWQSFINQIQRQVSCPEFLPF